MKIEQGYLVIVGSGRELTEEIRTKYLSEIEPELRSNEEWRRESRREGVDPCLPGGCPQSGDWPAPRFDLDESD